MPPPALPEVFGDFLLLQRLDASAMAEVLVAVRLGERSGRTYVVKRPTLGERSSGRAAQAVAREGEVLAAVRAPGVVALAAAGEIAGLPYVAVEHVRGVALDVLLSRAGPLPAAAARAVAIDLARALEAVHAAGWVHSDVAPSNVLVDDAGEARLIDFGTAARAGSRRLEITGKPGYVAPEAVRPALASGAEDVYGWGLVAAECALGRRLFDEKDLAEAGSRGEPGRALGDLEDQAQVRAALAREASARPSAGEIASALGAKAVDRAVLADRVAEASRGSEAGPARPPAADAALTPTAPMAVRATIPATRVEPAASAPSPRPAAPAAPAGAELARPALPPSRTSLALVAVTCLVVGLAVGRFTARARTASVSFPGNLPRRIEVKLDGRAVTPPVDGSPLPVAPGRHTISVQLPRQPVREYVFTARAGEQVVLLPLTRAAGAVPELEERAP